MDGTAFARMYRCGDLRKLGITSTDVDLAFTRVVPFGKRQLDSKHFEMALETMATRSGIEVQAIYDAVARTPGPMIQGTWPDPVRFHDDKRTYTGTHAKGGPAP